MRKAASRQVYTATRICAQGTLDEWCGDAIGDESALHRLGQHLKTKTDQHVEGYGLDDMVTLLRPDGEIVTVARAKELIGRLRGWKPSRTTDPDLEAE